MVANRTDQPAPGNEAAKPEPAQPPVTPTTAAPSGLQAMLPLIVALVAMPILAYITTNFVLIPKVQKAMNSNNPTVVSESSSATKASSHGGHGAKKESSSATEKFYLQKLLVNVAGTAGSRYLLTSLAIVPASAEVRAQMEEKKDQLIDLACGALASKTIRDLEKPEARNLIRSEIKFLFNSALGDGAVKEIFITEFAVQ